MSSEKNNLEKQFEELYIKAKGEYPDINDSIATYSNVCDEVISINEFIYIQNPYPTETSSNSVS